MNISIQILDAPSQLTDRTKDDFYRCIESRSRSGADWIGVDLSTLDVIDSLGLGSLLAAQKIAALHHKRLILFSPQSHIWRGLKSTGLCNIIKVYDSFREAIQDAAPRTFSNSSRLIDFEAITFPREPSIHETELQVAKS